MMFTLQNTTGYTQQQCDELNTEFAARVAAGYYDKYPDGEAEKAFSDEIASR
jgi:hypothetical protein